ncbi:CapA family protein [Patescibacteria group bacterium]|nr:CapA family protein [Patescibacteria group bacterium]MBU1890448.1 CapA family protein [Patescibacteria group bacterium]
MINTPRFQLFAYSMILLACMAAAFFIYKAFEGMIVPDENIYIVQPPPQVKGEQVSVPQPKEDVTVIAVGDIMLGRYVETLMDKKGSTYPFEKISPLLQSADLVIGNLEGPITINHQQTPNNSLSFSFEPNSANILRQNNFDYVSLANNHTFDRGVNGYDNTVAVLKESGVSAFGHPLEIDERYLQSKSIDGHKILFIGLNATRPDFDQQETTDIISNVSAEQDVFTIISIHWGSEYQTTSNQRQRDLAHALIDRGADLILGHHPHVTQELELYKDRLIVYSLGNFIFDQYFSEETQQGLALSFTLKDGTVKYMLNPLASHQSQPELMDESDSQEWLNSLAQKSTTISQANIEQGIVELLFDTEKKICPCQSR